jgi:hypothetical protein
MYSRIIFNFLLILAVSVVQLSLFSVLPRPFDSISIVVIALVFILIMGEIELALWWALGMGTMLDFYSALPFGTNIIALSATAFLLNFLLTYYLTNRSLYSFITMTALAVIANGIFKSLITTLFDVYRGNGFIFNYSWALVSFELKAILANIVMMIILFYFTNLIGQWLKPVFLIRRSK